MLAKARLLAVCAVVLVSAFAGRADARDTEVGVLRAAFMPRHVGTIVETPSGKIYVFDPDEPSVKDIEAG